MKIFRLDNIRISRIVCVVICFSLLTNVFSNFVFAQNSSEIPAIIKIGIDTSAKEVGYFVDSNNNEEFESNEAQGFCRTFGDELVKSLTRKYSRTFKVDYKPIINKYFTSDTTEAEESHSHRYDSLKADNSNKLFFKDIICGANTNFFLLNDIGNYTQKIEENNWKHVQFSNSFHKAGIKLLLKKESDADENLKKIPIENKEDIKREIDTKTILVMKESTTAYQLSDNYLIDDTMKIRDKVIDKLINSDKHPFYASDTLILKKLLDKKLEELGYIIYPADGDGYLPGTKVEEYGIVISNEIDKLPYIKDLRRAINEILPQNYGTDEEIIDNKNIKTAIDKLRDLEGEINSSDPEPEPDPELEPEPDPDPEDKCPDGQICINKLGQTAIIFFIFGVICTYILQNNELRNQLFGSFISMIIGWIRILFNWIRSTFF